MQNSLSFSCRPFNGCFGREPEPVEGIEPGHVEAEHALNVHVELAPLLQVRPVLPPAHSIT